MHRLLIVGEHPANHSGFSRLTHYIGNICSESKIFGEVTVIGTNARPMDLDPGTHSYILINNKDYITKEIAKPEDVTGLISISKFLASNENSETNYHYCLMIGDPWNQNHIHQLKALHPHTDFIFYCPVEGESLPEKVVHQLLNTNNNPFIDLHSIIRAFDLVIPYSNVGKKALLDIENIDPRIISKPIYHSVKLDKIVPKTIKELASIIQDRFVITWLGRNCFRKGLDIAIQTIANIDKYFPDSKAILLLHTPINDSFGYDIDTITKQIFKDRLENIDKRIVILEKIVPTTFTSTNGNVKYKDVKKGIDNDQLEYIYSVTDVLLNTSRSEGFGYPIAEAMARAIPVVCSNYATPAEILREAKCEELIADTANSHIYFANGNNCKMGQPDALELAKILYVSLEENKTKRYNVGQKVFNFARERLIINGNSDLEKIPELITNIPIGLTRSNVIMLTSYLDKCGIKTYTDHLKKHLDFTLLRTKNLIPIIEVFEHIKNRILHIQYEPALWDMEQLLALCNKASKYNKVVITVHTANDTFKKFSMELSSISKFIFHKVPENLSGFFSIEPTQYIEMPHPFAVYPLSLGRDARRTLAGYEEDDIVIGLNGFVLPYKQIPSQAAQILNGIKSMPKNYKLLIVASPHDNDKLGMGKTQLDSIKEFANTNGVLDRLQIIYEFMPSEKMASWLNVMDFAVFYHNNGNVGAQSGSIRELISSGVIPIVRTGKNLSMHDDLIQNKCVIAIKSNEGEVSPQQFASMATSVIYKLTNGELDAGIIDEARSSMIKYIDQNSFEKAGKIHEALYNGLK
jgi:glycosyltransferase involved in cell wall biosynthesis